jgi:nucleoside-diphosphate-sugar epimerase
MLYALTGATGFVGGALVSRLRSDGHDVRALVRTPGRAEALSAAGVELVRGDLDDGAALAELCRDVDALFHVAGWYKLGQRDPSVGTRVNVDGTRSTLAAAQRAGVPKVVYTSTVAVNSDTHGEVHDETHPHAGPYTSHYDRTKAEAHAVAERFAADGLDVRIVMPGVVYGPGDTAQTGELIAQVVRGGRPQVPAGGGGCWAHVDDVADGHVRAMEAGRAGEAYMLAGPRSTLADVLRAVASLAGTKGPIVLPDVLVRGTAAVAGVVGRVVPLPPGYAAETMRAGLATYYGTGAKAERELGWHPRDLDTGLRETVTALRPR